MNHTPGPWEYDGKFRVGIPHKDGWTGFRTNPNDARLIAAAPELLAACKAVAEFYGINKDMGSPLEWDLGRKVRAAIAKAEGKP
jgi:hypothetical protein